MDGRTARQPNGDLTHDKSSTAANVMGESTATRSHPARMSECSRWWTISAPSSFTSLSSLTSPPASILPLSSPALALALNPRPSWVSLPRSEQLPADGGASSSALGGLKPSTRPAGPARQRGSTGRQTQARLPSGSSEPRRPSSRSWLAAKLPIFQALDARRSR